MLRRSHLLKVPLHRLYVMHLEGLLSFACQIKHPDAHYFILLTRLLDRWRWTYDFLCHICVESTSLAYTVGGDNDNDNEF